MPDPDYAGAIAYALRRLHTELPAELTYHNAWHTEHDVMPAAVRLALLSGLPESDIRLLQVAAAYHDIGFVDVRSEHERRGAAIAAEMLPQYGLAPESIERIIGMIMATRLPQSPTNIVEQIICDADLDVLGREDFLKRNHDLRSELTQIGQTITDYDWIASQIRFLQQHSYFTPAARALRGARHQANLDHFIAQHDGGG
jgi:uncharacterized protein